MTVLPRWVSPIAGVGVILLGLMGYANVSRAHPPDLVLQLDMTACKPRCMTHEVVRRPAAAMQARTVWGDDSQSVDARVVLKPRSIEWWVGAEQAPRFVLEADPRLHAADGGLREQWDAAMNRVFLARSLLYTAYASRQPTMTVSAHRSSDTEILLSLQNMGKPALALEAIFIDRSYGLQRRLLSPMIGGEARELRWSVDDTRAPAHVVLRVRGDDGARFLATTLEPGP